VLERYGQGNNNKMMIESTDLGGVALELLQEDALGGDLSKGLPAF
jgi:hypothetical protein